MNQMMRPNEVHIMIITIWRNVCQRYTLSNCVSDTEVYYTTHQMILSALNVKMVSVVIVIHLYSCVLLWKRVYRNNKNTEFTDSDESWKKEQNTQRITMSGTTHTHRTNEWNGWFKRYHINRIKDMTLCSLCIKKCAYEMKNKEGKKTRRVKRKKNMALILCLRLPLFHFLPRYEYFEPSKIVNELILCLFLSFMVVQLMRLPST